CIYASVERERHDIKSLHEVSLMASVLIEHQANVHILVVFNSHHLHQCPQHRHLPLHCCQCLSGLGCYCRGSCHSGHPRHHGHSHTAWDCTRKDSCPVSKREECRVR
uniref:Uncharacterized protein n=1 Tax=Amphilophus citrinellus TaxID=61819 RepID=A0A3Q0RUX4_AMPCI